MSSAHAPQEFDDVVAALAPALQRVSFAFAKLHLVFEGTPGLRAQVACGAGRLHAAAAACGLALQVDTATDAEGTARAVLAAARAHLEAWRGRRGGHYAVGDPPTPQETFFSRFPSLNPHSAGLLAGCGLSLREVLSLGALPPERVPAALALVPTHSMDLFLRTAAFGAPIQGAPAPSGAAAAAAASAAPHAPPAPAPPPGGKRQRLLAGGEWHPGAHANTAATWPPAPVDMPAAQQQHQQPPPPQQQQRSGGWGAAQDDVGLQPSMQFMHGRLPQAPPPAAAPPMAYASWARPQPAQHLRARQQAPGQAAGESSGAELDDVESFAELGAAFETPEPMAGGAGGAGGAAYAAPRQAATFLAGAGLAGFGAAPVRSAAAAPPGLPQRPPWGAAPPEAPQQRWMQPVPMPPQHAAAQQYPDHQQYHEAQYHREVDEFGMPLHASLSDDEEEESDQGAVMSARLAAPGGYGLGGSYAHPPAQAPHRSYMPGLAPGANHGAPSVPAVDPIRALLDSRPQGFAPPRLPRQPGLSGGPPPGFGPGGGGPEGSEEGSGMSSWQAPASGGYMDAALDR
jgi:hypothetical protein